MSKKQWGKRIFR